MTPRRRWIGYRTLVAGISAAIGCALITLLSSAPQPFGNLGVQIVAGNAQTMSPAFMAGLPGYLTALCEFLEFALLIGPIMYALAASPASRTPLRAGIACAIGAGIGWIVACVLFEATSKVRGQTVLWQCLALVSGIVLIVGPAIGVIVVTRLANRLKIFEKPATADRRAHAE